MKKITRTIETTLYGISAYNKATKEVENNSVYVSGLSEKQAKAYIRKQYSGTDKVIVDITRGDSKAVTYEMDINMFVELATIKEDTKESEE